MSEVVSVAVPQTPVADVVFVHGLDGDARASWMSKGEGTFWPDWLGEDVPGAAVWSVGYAARSWGWRGRSMPILDRAVNVMAALQNRGVGGRPLVFVTHSMGGLLVKQILLHAAESRTDLQVFAATTRGVVFLGTPHVGSNMAAVADALGVAYRATPAVKDLRKNSAYLRDLNDRYRDWVAGSGIGNLVFCETRLTNGVWVVDQSSANPGLVGVRAIPVDANHTEICKPATRDALVYGQVRRFITALLDTGAGSSHPEAPKPVEGVDPPPTGLATTAIVGVAAPASGVVAVRDGRDPRVFLSYAQEDGHSEVVLEFWAFLRANGIDAQLDRPGVERRDWTLWMADQIREADVVLCIASELYRERAEGRAGPNRGRGAQWEARLIRDAFHAAQDDLQKFVPVVLPGQSVDGVPDFLAPSTTTVHTIADFTVPGAMTLLRFLLNQPEVPDLPIGRRPRLPTWSPGTGGGGPDPR